MRSSTFIPRWLHAGFLLTLIAILSANLAPGMASAAGLQQTSPAVAMEAHPAFNGYFKYGEWLPVYVQLENNGGDISGEIRVRITDSSGTTVYAAPAELAGGARKRIPLYILPNSFSHELEVQYVAASQVVASQKISVNPQANINFLIGTVAPETEALTLIRTVTLPGQPRQLVLTDISLADLPERPEGLASLDLLILNNTDTSALNVEQTNALELWVRSGGRLVIGGGAGATTTLAGLPPSLLPFTAQDVVELDALDGLSQYSGNEEVRVPGPFPVVTGQAQRASVLAAQEGTPLVYEWSLGGGFVNLVTLDLTASPFDAWAGAGTFWRILLSPSARYPEWLPYDMSPRQQRATNMGYALTNLPALDLPSIRGLAVLLSVYVLLVGPVNYLVLRWRRKLHWAWVTIPAITVLFSAGAFTLGYALRGTDLILNKISIIEARPGNTAFVTSYMGLFSPTRQSYEIEVKNASLLSPLQQAYDPWGMGGMNTLGEITLVQGEPSVLRGLAINQWSMQSFSAETSWPDFGQVQSELELSGQQLTGSVTNTTGVLLKGAVLIMGNNFTHLGDIAAGATVPVDIKIESLVGRPFDMSLSYQILREELERPSPTGPSRETMLKQSILDSLFPYGSMGGSGLGLSGKGSSKADLQPLLIAWTDQAPPDVSVRDRRPAQNTTGLVLAPLTYHLPPGDQISLAPGFVPGTVTQLNDAGYCGPMGMPAVYMGRQEVVFEFTIPETILAGELPGQETATPLEITSLLVQVGSDVGWENLPLTSIFDWDAQSWVELTNLKVGQNSIAVQEGLVAENGAVRFKFEPKDMAGGCYFMAVGLEGQR